MQLSMSSVTRPLTRSLSNLDAQGTHNFHGFHGFFAGQPATILPTIELPTIEDTAAIIVGNIEGGSFHFSRATVHLENKNIEGFKSELLSAIQYFDEAIRLIKSEMDVPDDETMGNLYFARGGATFSLDIGLRLVSPQASPYLKKAIADLVKSKKHFVKSAHLNRARTALFLLGSAYMCAKKWSDAIACFKDIIQQDIYCAPAFICRGLAYRELGEMDEYEEDFRIAVSLQPDLVNDETHGVEFSRIKERNEKENEKWEAAFALPESKIFLEQMAEEVLDAHRRGETKLLDIEDLK